MKKVISLGLLFLFCFQGCGKKNEIIAKIGDDKITTKIVEERMQEAPSSYMGFLSTEAGKKQFLDLLIREKVVLEAARKEGVKKSKEYTDALNNFKKDQIKRLRDFEESLLMEIYVKKLNSKRIVVSDQEVEKYYAENKKDFIRPVEITAKHILLNTVEEAKNVLARIRNGEDFSKLAKELSKDSVSAARGGLIGPFKKGDLVPEFEKAVFPLKINEVSDVIKTQFGYHVIKKVSQKTLTAISGQDAKKYIRNILQKVKFDEWLEEAKKKYGLQIHYERLKDIIIRPSVNLSEMIESEAKPIAKKEKKVEKKTK